MPRCDIITPNTVEAAYLADMPEVTTVEQIKEAAEKIVAAGAKSVVIKGGERLSDNSAIDIFTMARNSQKWLCRKFILPTTMAQAAPSRQQLPQVWQTALA